MTITQYIEKHGWIRECDALDSYRSMDVNVGFDNKECLDGVDETQFLINAHDTEELAELFECFCLENGLEANTVNNIYIVNLYKDEA